MSKLEGFSPYREGDLVTVEIDGESGPFVFKVVGNISKTQGGWTFPHAVKCRLLDSEDIMTFTLSTVRHATPHEIAEYKLGQRKK